MVFCRVTDFTSDFLSFIVVEHIRFFHGVLQLSCPCLPVSDASSMWSRMTWILLYNTTSCLRITLHDCYRSYDCRLLLSLTVNVTGCLKLKVISSRCLCIFTEDFCVIRLNTCCVLTSLCDMIVTTESCPNGSQSAPFAAVGDNVTTSCWLNYRGSIAPHLQWTPGGQTTNHTNTSTVMTSLSTVVQPGMTIVLSQSCSVSFPGVPVHPTCASWRSSEISVTCMYVLLLSRTSVL